MALDKPAEQLGISGKKNTADRAVDGDTNPVMDDGSCAHPSTEFTDQAPVWWYVDLGQSYRITQVLLYNRASNGSASKYVT